MKSIERILKRNTRVNQLYPRYLSAYGLDYRAANVRDVDGTPITLYTIYNASADDVDGALSEARRQSDREDRRRQ